MARPQIHAKCWDSTHSRTLDSTLDSAIGSTPSTETLDRVRAFFLRCVPFCCYLGKNIEQLSPELVLGNLWSRLQKQTLSFPAGGSCCHRSACKPSSILCSSAPSWGLFNADLLQCLKPFEKKGCKGTSVSEASLSESKSKSPVSPSHACLGSYDLQSAPGKPKNMCQCYTWSCIDVFECFRKIATPPFRFFL